MQFSYKIEIICRVFIITNIQLYTVAFGQVKPLKNPVDYYHKVWADSFQRMIEIKTFVPNVLYDLRYATKNNFTGRKLYRSGNETFSRLSVARALQKVQNELNQEGYGLKIFDAYRPYSVTEKMWDLVHDERYVANPKNGSGHNRGLAVDLTIVNLKDGNELNMGTGFDNFTDSAHQSFTALSADVLANRKRLRQVMERNGFKALDTEWWHYSWPNDRNYDVLDIDFKKLKKYAH